MLEFRAWWCDDRWLIVRSWLVWERFERSIQFGSPGELCGVLRFVELTVTRCSGGNSRNYASNCWASYWDLSSGIQGHTWRKERQYELIHQFFASVEMLWTSGRRQTYLGNTIQQRGIADWLRLSVCLANGGTSNNAAKKPVYDFEQVAAARFRRVSHREPSLWE